MSTVLVVEDNEDNLRLVTYTLSRAGYTVVSAESGEAALAQAQGETPEFVLMDINLPGIDGIETTRRLREHEPFRAVPIIAVTSFAMIGDRERILNAGCNGYIEKPIDPFTFIEQIEKIIGAHR